MQQHAIVYFPHIDLYKLDSFREKYDPDWKIIKPHITLVSPLSGISEELLIAHSETITKEIKSFPIVLSGLIKSFDDHLFLQVKEGNEKIANVHDKLYSGILATHLQIDVPYIPHITLGYFGNENNGFNKELYEKAYEEAEKMNINVTFSFDNITLIKGDGTAPAIIIKTFNLN
jgi:2'-5' RNA ligase